jgi:hypothetical protein
VTLTVWKRELEADATLRGEPRAELTPPDSRDPAWQPDPTDRHEQRYWDGVRWTEHVSDAGTTDVDPLVVERPK